MEPGHAVSSVPNISSEVKGQHLAISSECLCISWSQMCPNLSNFLIRYTIFALKPCYLYKHPSYVRELHFIYVNSIHDIMSGVHHLKPAFLKPHWFQKYVSLIKLFQSSPFVAFFLGGGWIVSSVPAGYSNLALLSITPRLAWTTFNQPQQQLIGSFS